MRDGVSNHLGRTKFRLQVAQCAGDRGGENIAREIKRFGVTGGGVDDRRVFLNRFEDLGDHILQVDERKWTARIAGVDLSAVDTGVYYTFHLC